MPWLTVHNVTDLPLVVDHRGRQVPARGYGSAQSEQPYVVVYVSRALLIPVPDDLVSTDPTLSAEVAAAIAVTEQLKQEPYPEIPQLPDLDLGQLTFAERMALVEQRLQVVESRSAPTAASIGAIPVEARGAASGVAPLDAGQRVPAQFLPPALDTSSFVARSELTAYATDLELANAIEAEAAARTTADNGIVTEARDAALASVAGVDARVDALEAARPTNVVAVLREGGVYNRPPVSVARIALHLGDTFPPTAQDGDLYRRVPGL